MDCGGNGIGGDQVSDCSGQSGGNGAGVYATTAHNCTGTSVGGYGVYGQNLHNCTGSSTSGTGLYAVYNAMGCTGISTSGTAGLHAANASFCVGYRNNGTAISATVATGCYGEAGTNNIVYKLNTP